MSLNMKLPTAIFRTRYMLKMYSVSSPSIDSREKRKVGRTQIVIVYRAGYNLEGDNKYIIHYFKYFGIHGRNILVVNK